MPNWVYNTIAVKGSKKNVIEFIKKINKKVSIDDSIDTILYTLNKSKKRPSFDSFVPMPKTFADYDTTNHYNGDGVHHEVARRTNLYANLKFVDGVDKSNFYKSLEKANKYIIDYNIDKVVTLSCLHQILFNEFATVSSLSKDEVENIVKDYANALYDEVIAYKKATKYQKEKYGVVGWYDWSCANYGVKWNARFNEFDLDMVGNEYLLKLYCETAWDVPYEFLNKLHKKYPNLRIAVRTYEEQPTFNGYFNVDDACWIENHEYCDWEDSELWESIEDNFRNYIYDVL